MLSHALAYARVLSRALACSRMLSHALANATGASLPVCEAVDITSVRNASCWVRIPCDQHVALNNQCQHACAQH
eukprot:10515307-Lingulodinium_polyedra.AAC.1